MSNTTIRLKNSGVTGNVPTSLEEGEIAINFADGVLFYGNTASQVTPFAAAVQPSGLNTEVQFNNLGVLGASSGFTYDKYTETLSITNIESTTTSNISSRLNAAFTTANTGLTTASAAFTTANTGLTTASAAFTTANTGLTHASAAFTTANTDVTSVSATASTYGSSIQVPVFALLANGRVSTVTNTTIQSGTTSQTGVVQLTDSTSSTSTTTAATPNSVKVAYDLAATKFNSSGGTISGNLIVTGNLSIQGETTYIDVSTLKVEDKNIELGNVATPTNITANGGGITILGTTNKTFTWSNTTGNWESNVGIAAPSITLASSYETTNTYTTSSVSQVTVDSFPVATYRSAKYIIQLTSGSAYHVLELNVIHDGTNVYMSQFGDVKTGVSLGSFDSTIVTGIMNLLFTPSNAVTVVKLIRHNITT